MQRWETIERAKAPGGEELVLARRGDEWVVRVGGQTLMSSRAHASEQALASLTLGRAARKTAVLVGGLGLGYTLRATLNRMPPDSKVVVVELSRELIAWNRGPVADLAGRPLDDPRVRLEIGDVRKKIAEAHRAYDAILLDVDNGPSALVTAGNKGLYSRNGIAACKQALHAGGVLGVWSAGPDERYRALLENAGFKVEEQRVAETPGGGRRCVIYLASL